MPKIKRFFSACTGTIVGLLEGAICGPVVGVKGTYKSFRNYYHDYKNKHGGHLGKFRKVKYAVGTALAAPASALVDACYGMVDGAVHGAKQGFSLGIKYSVTELPKDMWDNPFDSVAAPLFREPAPAPVPTPITTPLGPAAKVGYRDNNLFQTHATTAPSYEQDMELGPHKEEDELPQYK